MRGRLFFAAFFLIVLYSAGGQDSRTIRMTFIGDIMGHTVNYRMRDFHDIYRGVEDVLKADDLTFANLEFPVDPIRPVAGYPLFNGSREYWKAAIDSGVEVFSLANNHAFDQGIEGLFQTLRSAAFLRSRLGEAVYVSGIRGNPKTPFLAQEISVKGMRIGFIAATQFINQGIPCPYVNIVDYADRKAAEEFISFVRDASRGFDLFIVSYHGGREYAFAPSPQMNAFFHRLLGSGAHIVYGHHPHVFQGFQLVKMGTGLGVVLPSMGNFISGMTWFSNPAAIPAAIAPTGDSALLRVEALREENGVRISRADSIPISNYRDALGEIVVGKLRELAEGKAGVSPSWTLYYRARLGAMESILAPSVEGP